MARPTTTQRLASYQARYAQLASQLADIGFITAGSVTRRYTRCASPGCRCNAEPPQPHGPYYQWTAVTVQPLPGGVGTRVVGSSVLRSPVAGAVDRSVVVGGGWHPGVCGHEAL